MALTGEIALKDYIKELEDHGISVILTSDIRNGVGGFRLDILKGEFIESEMVQPWVATSANWEWLLIFRIRDLLEKLERKIRKENRK